MPLADGAAAAGTTGSALAWPHIIGVAGGAAALAGRYRDPEPTRVSGRRDRIGRAATDHIRGASAGSRSLPLMNAPPSVSLVPRVCLQSCVLTACPWRPYRTAVRADGTRNSWSVLPPNLTRLPTFPQAVKTYPSLRPLRRKLSGTLHRREGHTRRDRCNSTLQGLFVSSDYSGVHGTGRRYHTEQRRR